jgi:hypothetical protein
MRLWKTPERLRRIALFFYGVIPILFFASLLARRMPWWQWNPTKEWPVWAGIALATTLIVFALLRTKRWALILVMIMGGCITLFTLALAIRQENVALGLFSVTLGITAFAYADRLASAFQVPAILPGVRWYQSLPEPIPGISIDWGQQKGLRLSQLDLDGLFVLGTFPRGTEKNLPSEMLLHYRGSKMTCDVQILSALASPKIDSSWAGIGVEFKNNDRDTRKELSDFIEVLRGEGHVST